MLQLLISVLEGYFLCLCKIEWYVSLFDVVFKNLHVVLKLICQGFIVLSSLVLLLQVVLQSLNLPLHDDQLTLHFLQFLHDLVVLLIFS